MRILLISHFYPPSHTAGTEQYTQAVAQGLHRLGHQAAVLCAGHWTQGSAHYNGFSDDTFNDVPVRRLHFNWSKAPDPNRYLYDNPVAAELVVDYMGQFRPDVVHVTSCYSLSASILTAAKSCGMPLVLTLTDFWFLCPRHTLLRGDGELCTGQTTAGQCLNCMLHGTDVLRTLAVMPAGMKDGSLSWISRHSWVSRQRGLRGLALPMADRKANLKAALDEPDVVIAPSEFLQQVHHSAGIDRPMRVLRYGHDLSWVYRLPRKLSRTPENTIRFVYLGQIAPVKGIDLLLDAWELADTGNRARLQIWGQLKDTSAYCTSIRQHVQELDNVELKGPFAHDALAEVLGDADVVVVPSVWYENDPLVIQEAFAAGLPVIATRLGGMSEFVTHRLNGLLFERNCAEDLATQIQNLIDEPGLFDSLVSGIPTVIDIGDAVGQLVDLYAEF